MNRSLSNFLCVCIALSFRNQEIQGLYHEPAVFMVGLYLSIYGISVNRQFLFSHSVDIDCIADIYTVLSKTGSTLTFHFILHYFLYISLSILLLSASGIC
jgi:elongation factor P--beta-lysine ligase